MALIHWNPTREMESIRQELDRAFDRTFNTLSSTDAVASPLQLWETADAYIARLALAGADADSLNIEAGPYGLAISGRVNFEAPENAKMLYREFGNGEFSRQFKVPTQIKTDGVIAAFDGGILTVTLPKVSSSKVVKVSLADTNGS